MRKKLIFLWIFILTFTMLPGCGREEDPNRPVIDPNKTQINVHVSGGGYGREWLDKAARDWEAEPGNEKYQIIPYVNSDEDYLVMENDIKNGTGQDIYFLSHPVISNLINGDYLVDLSDTIEEDILGESESIRDKMKYPEINDRAFRNREGEGCYAIPYGDSFTGFIFDFELFRDNGWLLTDSDGNLTVGRDGKPGTYDDGQPDTIAEWDAMIQKILIETNTYPFIYNTTVPGYETGLIDSLFYQYAGEEEYRTFLEYSGEITVDTASGGTEKITVSKEDGYKVYGSTGLRIAMEFADKYLTNNQSWIYPKAYQTTQYSHTDAQKDFLFNFEPTAANPQAALLHEGIWWENESRTRGFQTLENRGYPERGYGKREYRIMLYPRIDGQKETKSVLSALDCGATFVVKSKDAAKQEKMLDFLKYTTKDKYLKGFTLSNGSVRPYKYTLTEGELATLTPFQRNVWAIANDTENVTIIRPDMQARSSPFVGTSSKLDRYISRSASGANYTQPFAGLMRVTAAEYIDGMKYYNESNWTKWLGGN